MNITIDLTAVPVNCWWRSGLSLYLMLCWLVIGPLMSRRYYQKHKWGDGPTEAALLWFFSPVLTPLLMIKRPLCWLIYGSSK